MVSLRRRRNLGLSSDLPHIWFDDEAVGHFGPPPANHFKSHPIILTDMEKNGEIDSPSKGLDSLNSSKQENDEPSPVKHRTRDRKIYVHGREVGSVRGVYLKNMKWQAAIKVNNKQIHLGTLETPEQAARVYDRAAFVMGRLPNFVLPEEDKQELRQLKWDEFLERTKLERSCNRKRKQRDDPQVKDSQNETRQGVVEIASW